MSASLKCARIIIHAIQTTIRNAWKIYSFGKTGLRTIVGGKPLFMLMPGERKRISKDIRKNTEMKWKA